MGALGGMVLLGFAPVVALPVGASNHSIDPVVTSASFIVSIEVQVPGGTPVSWRAEGEANFAHHEAEEFVTLPRTDLRALGTESRPGNPTIKLLGKWVQDHAYVTLAGVRPAVMDGAQALSVTVSVSKAHLIDLALTQSAVALSYPDELLTDLAGSQTRRSAGQRRMNGSMAVGTKLELTLAQLLKVSPGLSPTMSGDLDSFAGEEIPTTVWINRAGRLAEVTFDRPAQTGTASVKGSIQFFNYNEPVTVPVPAADAVRPVSANLRLMLVGLNLFQDTPLP
jgi:hypothetical protein